MTSQENNSPEVLVSESPASWNTRYQSPEGFVCQLTLRAETGSELLKRVAAAVEHLLENDCKPYPAPIHVPGAKAISQAKEDDAVRQSNGAGRSIPPVQEPTRMCQIHGMPMKMWQKNNRTWFSHKIDGEWCNGRHR